MECYDRFGRPIDVGLWGTLHRDPDYKRVALDTIDDLFVVSTVWLGFDHGFGSGPPLIFETMVFMKGTGYQWGDFCARYATEAAALAGHDQACAEVRDREMKGTEK